MFCVLDCSYPLTYVGKTKTNCVNSQRELDQDLAIKVYIYWNKLEREDH